MLSLHRMLILDIPIINFIIADIRLPIAMFDLDGNLLVAFCKSEDSVQCQRMPQQYGLGRIILEITFKILFVKPKRVI
jgi:hypothetical protein